MSTKRLRKWCKFALFDRGKMTTDGIKRWINKNSSHGTTTHGLANILGRDKRTFRRAGSDTLCTGTDFYPVTIWDLTEEARCEMAIMFPDYNKDKEKDDEYE